VTLRLAVLVSGRGSNLQAVRRAIDEGELDASIDLVVTNRAGCPALAFAEGLEVAVLPVEDYATRALWDRVLAEAVVRASPHVVLLAGFDRVVGAPLLEAFPDAVLNLHPSLLPAFPGRFAVRDALAHGVTISGSTIHVVDPEGPVDSGPIVAQAPVRVFLSDDEASLSARIRATEHALVVAVLQEYARGAVRVMRLPGHRPRVISAFSSAPSS
jgi:phosphoribosylglycinamide formyltransferase-1